MTFNTDINDTIVIDGGVPLHGRVKISGAKNSALPIMAAIILADEPTIIENIPILEDIFIMEKLMQAIGLDISIDEASNKLYCDNTTIKSTVAPYEIVSQIRASFLVLGPLLGKYKQAKVALPGGCAIGLRPVNMHIDTLETMGASIKMEHGYVIAEADDGLKSCTINFPKVSVGATQNTAMAAVLAAGEEFHITNAAIEPEVTDLLKFLVKMGAKVDGIGTPHLTIRGVNKLHGTTYNIIEDRIETITYIMAASITNGDLYLDNANIASVELLCDEMHQVGIKIQNEGPSLHVECTDSTFNGINLITSPYPGFPTDLQAQFTALLSCAKGTSTITETIFENRFMHVPELNRMGANITVTGNMAIINGVDQLYGTIVNATDLRASAALIVAGLAAQGKTTINNAHHIYRGYDNIHKKLSQCNARINLI